MPFKRALICAGVSAGVRSSMRATTPATTGAAIDVPESRKYAGASGSRPATSRSGNSWSSVLPGERRLTILRPGATRSGFARPSIGVMPREDHEASASSSGVAVPLSSMPPTVITYGSVPGDVIVRSFGPSLPADTTTVMPAKTSTSAAVARGSSRYVVVAGPPAERLTTRML